MFKWFIELFTLIKMLFKSINKYNDIELINMKYFPFREYTYMAWCGKVITKKNIKWEDIGQYIKNEEIGHLKQASFYNYWIQYYLVYVWEWIKGNPFTSPYKSAYYTIPFEIQARANRHNPDYDYNRVDLKNKYTLKNRKRIYKENRKGWTKYIKTL